jgi:hypothetical protein
MGGVWGVCVCSTALLIIRVCPCVRGAFVLFHVLRFRSAPQAICVDMLLNKSSPTEVANDLEALKSLSGVRELRYVTNDFFQFAYAGVSWFGDHLQLLLRASLIDAKVVCCVCGHFFLTTGRHTHAHHTYVCSRAITNHLATLPSCSAQAHTCPFGELVFSRLAGSLFSSTRTLLSLLHR